MGWLRGSIFPWLGIIGAANTLVAFTRGLVPFSPLLEPPVVYWESTLLTFWRDVLALGPRIDPFGAMVLSFLVFVVMNSVSASMRPPPAFKGAWTRLIIIGLIVVGLFSLKPLILAGHYAEAGYNSGGFFFDLHARLEKFLVFAPTQILPIAVPSADEVNVLWTAWVIFSFVSALAVPAGVLAVITISGINRLLGISFSSAGLAIRMSWAIGLAAALLVLNSVILQSENVAAWVLDILLHLLLQLYGLDSAPTPL